MQEQWIQCEYIPVFVLNLYKPDKIQNILEFPHSLSQFTIGWVSAPNLNHNSRLCIYALTGQSFSISIFPFESCTTDDSTTHNRNNGEFALFFLCHLLKLTIISWEWNELFTILWVRQSSIFPLQIQKTVWMPMSHCTVIFIADLVFVIWLKRIVIFAGYENGQIVAAMHTVALIVAYALNDMKNNSNIHRPQSHTLSILYSALRIVMHSYVPVRSIISFNSGENIVCACECVCEILAYRYWPHYIRSDHKFVCMSVWFNSRKSPLHEWPMFVIAALNIAIAGGLQTNNRTNTQCMYAYFNMHIYMSRVCDSFGASANINCNSTPNVRVFSAKKRLRLFFSLTSANLCANR